MKADTYNFWTKKILLSYFLAVLVFMIHISTFANYIEPLGSRDIAKPLGWFVMAISRCAVPTFFIISGAVFFRDYTNDKYLQKLKSRIYTLLIPYLSWNTIWMIFGVVTTIYFSQYFYARIPSDLSPMGMLLSIVHYTDNGPFWFIFNLIVFILVSPIIYLALKNKYVGGIVVVLVMVVNELGYGLPIKVFFESESIVYYMVGAYVGIHAFQWFSSSSKAKSVCGILMIILCIWLRTSYPEVINNISLRTVVLTIYGFSSCFAFDMVSKNICPPQFATRSFWVYAMHINVSAVITKLLFFVFPKTLFFAYLNFTITLILTLFLIEMTAIFFQRYCPFGYRMLSGGAK